MSFDQATDIVRESLTVMLLVSAPILLAGLAIGLVVGLLQAVTQIQEQTLSFVPKIVVMGIVTILLTPWVGRMLIEYAQRMFTGQ
ncbi:MAG: flagellar biosynthesis protein FliQ [Phycisphaeraceae bacterium]|nr:flagellar biosynthesis protein FliQ [Phycisphaeraceae bacterium]